jgi:hypothetical protein
VWLSLTPTLAAAQALGIGGSVAAGCLGSDGSVCGSGTHPLLGAYVAWWPADWTELDLRVSFIGLPSYSFQTEFPVKVRGTVADRSRTFVSAMFIHHFLPDRPVRPMLGFGSGGFARSARVACEPRCDGTLGLPREGPSRTWMTDAILIAGLSGTISKHWDWRGGWLSHRFLNDENSTIELFVGINYRLGSR